jgi:type IV pilus assembly protein PilB
MILLLAMMSLPDNFVLEILVRHGYLGQSDAEAALASASKNGHSVIKELESLGLIMPHDVSRAQAADAGLPFIEELEHIHQDAVNAVPKNFALRYHIMPILKDGPILRVAIANPYDLETQDILRNLLNTEIELVVAPLEVIQKAIKRYYGTLTESIDTLLSGTENTQEELILKTNTTEDEAGTATEGDAPIISMVNSIILDAHRMRASDIHLEPLEKRFRLRYRIDGVLQEMKDPPPIRHHQPDKNHVQNEHR